MKCRELALGAAALALAAVASPASAAGGTAVDHSANALTLAVYGDAPYGTSNSDTSEFQATPAFIESINRDPKVRLVVHVGDIHSGKQSCSESYDRSVYDLWTKFKDPLVYTPGDNEWTDCNKAAEGGGDPLANLDLVRSIFFPQSGVTLGGRPRAVLSQADTYDPDHPADSQYVENVMWQESRTLFVTVNLPGGSNNDEDPWYGVSPASAAQKQEEAQRTGADIRWLDAAFDRAQADDVKAVFIAWQADVWDPEKGAAHQTGYEPLVNALADDTTSFGRPVLMVNGDSHVYQSGNPFDPSDPNYSIHPGYHVPNFHRIVVHGSTFPLEWLKLTDDPRADAANGPDAFGPFSWQRQIQPQQ